MQDSTDKFCPSCNAFKPLTDYHMNRAMADGRQCYCKPCQNRRCRESRRTTRSEEESSGGEDTDDRYKTNMQGFGPGAWLEGEDAKHRAEYKAMARQRLERAEQRGVQVLGGHLAWLVVGVSVLAVVPALEMRDGRLRWNRSAATCLLYTSPSPRDRG